MSAAMWRLEVRGLHCAGCATRLDKILAAQPHVRSAAVDLLKGVAVLQVAPEASREAIAAAVEQAGFVAGAWRDAQL